MRSDSRHHGHHGHDEEDDFIEPPSKSSLKREMHALQDLGEQLVALSPERLKKVPLPDSLYEAVRAAQGFRMEARRRQMQYIGKLMREVDPEPIRTKLAEWAGQSKELNAKFHRLEALREKLLEHDSALGEVAEQFPGADLQRIRTLIRNARQEKAANKPPKSSRALFKELRALQEGGEAEAGDEEYEE